MRRCCSCGQSFKPTGKGYRCLCCRRAYDAKWRAKRKESGDPVKSTKMPRAYHRAYEADYFRDPANRARRAKLAKTYRDDPARRHKHEARWAVQRAIRSGRLVREPCHVCGKRRVDAHHDDYSKPLMVRWLCRTHHNEFHAKAEGRS